jgi:hypothetical protein
MSYEATNACFGWGGAYVAPNEGVRRGESENPAVHSFQLISSVGTELPWQVGDR